MNEAVKAELKKLGKLKQNSNISEEALTKNAERNVILRELTESGNFLDDAEKKLAKKIFEAYLDKLDFENFSDLSTLSTLVYSEVLSKRVEKSINKCTNKDGESFISDKLLKSHSDLTNQILHLKEKLGINKEQSVDEMTALGLLKKRFHQHIQENKNEFMLYVPFECGSCGKQDVKPVLLRRRIKDFEVLEHPHFAGRFWYCSEAINDVKEGKISKEQYARYFKTSCDFVTWCIDNEGKILPNTENK
jgi:hypothetical protein